MMTGPRAQSRTGSLVEAVANVGGGFAIAIVIQRVVYPFFDIEIDLVQNTAIAALFTASSLARSYALRRLFAAVEAGRERDRQDRERRLELRCASGCLPKRRVERR